MSNFLYKFIYRPEDSSIRVWNGNNLLTTISAGGSAGTNLSNNIIMEMCQKWLEDKEMLDVEYKVLVELK